MTIKHCKYNPNLLSLFILTIACAISLNGCTVAGPVGATLAVGSAYLSKERAQIRVTEDERDTKGCEFIKHVKASTYWGGMAFQDKALEKTISDLTHESVEAGANLLLIKSKHKSFSGSRSEGDAYRCPCRNNESTSAEEPNESRKKKSKETY